MTTKKTYSNGSKSKHVTNRLTTVLFIIYMIALYWILLFKLGVRFSNMGKLSVNLIPFGGSPVLAGENILNVIIFLPLGIYTGILFKKWGFTKILLFISSLSLLIEVLQYILRIGIFDVTDILTNTIGGVMGLLLFKGLEKALNDGIKAQKLINVVASIGTALMITLLVLLKMNRLPIRYQ